MIDNQKTRVVTVLTLMPRPQNRVKKLFSVEIPWPAMYWSLETTGIWIAENAQILVWI